MDGRSVGSRAWYALDSDQSRTSLTPVSLLRAGIAPASPAWAEIGGAALAYNPDGAPDLTRGALYTLARTEPASIDGQPGAALALRYLRRSFYSSLCHQPDRALDSAVRATAEYLRTLAWHGHALADCELAAAVVQGSHLWLATAGSCVAYLVRPATGGWRQLVGSATGSLLAHRATTQEAAGATTVLEPGDLVLLTTQVPETLIQSCLLTLLLHEPGASAQDIADTLTRLAAAEPPAGGAPLAVVLVCQAAVPAPPAGAARSTPGYRTLAVPAGFAWELGQVPAPAAASAQPSPLLPALAALPPALPAPPPRAWPSSVEASSWSEVATLRQATSSASPPAILSHLGSTRLALAALLPGWMTTQRRLARVLVPGTGLLAGAGFAGSWMTGQMPYLLVGCSLSGLLLYGARHARQTEPAAGASAALAKGRLLGEHLVPPAAPARARAWVPPPLRAAPALRRAAARESPAAAPRTGPTANGLTWTRDRLLLPPLPALAAGCLDIVSLRDVEGRINAQLVLLCPPHLLDQTSDCPQGIYVVLHDLLTDQQQAVAWLAPGQRRMAAVQRDVAGYRGNPDAHVRWLRGRPRFELASTRLRVALMLDQYRFTDPLKKQHIESLEVLLTGTQVLA